MKNKINFNLKTYNRFQFNNIINTEFTEFNQRNISEEAEQVPTVSEFFNMYNNLFYEIPQRGENSHESLIVRSTDYIDYVFENETIEALQREITQLREELLEEQLKTSRQLEVLNSSSISRNG
mgnify:CR=1 FL=1